MRKANAPSNAKIRDYHEELFEQHPAERERDREKSKGNLYYSEQPPNGRRSMRQETNNTSPYDWSVGIPEHGYYAIFWQLHQRIALIYVAEGREASEAQSWRDFERFCSKISSYVHEEAQALGIDQIPWDRKPLSNYSLYSRA